MFFFSQESSGEHIEFANLIYSDLTLPNRGIGVIISIYLNN